MVGVGKVRLVPGVGVCYSEKKRRGWREEGSTEKRGGRGEGRWHSGPCVRTGMGGAGDGVRSRRGG